MNLKTCCGHLIFRTIASGRRFSRSIRSTHKPLAYSRPDINLDFLDDEVESKRMEKVFQARGYLVEYQKLKDVWHKILSFSNEKTDDSSAKEYEKLWDQVSKNLVRTFLALFN